MGYLIILFFLFSCLLAYIEDMLPKMYRFIIYIFFGFCLVLMCGLKEIGLDPDSENYATSYIYYYSEKVREGIEPSFFIISAFLNLFTNDAHILFLFYAAIGVTLKMFSFYKFKKEHVFLLLTAYLSYYFVVHDMMQIRTGAMSAMLLMAINDIGENKRIRAVIFILIGAFFHVSGILMLPFVLLSNNPLKWWTGGILAGLVIIALLLSARGGNLMDILIHVPYVGDKLAIYQKAADVGQSMSTINGFGVFHLCSIALFLYLIIFSPTITAEDKYFPLLIKLYAVGLMSYTLLGFIPDLGARVSHIFRITSILLIADIMYTLRPRWVGVLCSQLVAFFYLNYELQFIQFPLLWKTAG